MFILTLLSLLAAPARAEPTITADSMIAQSTFRFSRPTVVRVPVQTCSSKGKVRALQLHVKEGSLPLKTMDAFYSVGGRQRLAANLKLATGQYSEWYVLSNQENPCLARLEMNIGANNVKTTVEVIGRWE